MMKHLKKAVAGFSVTVLLLALCLSLSGCGAIALGFSTVFGDTVHVYEDVSDYSRFFGPEATEHYIGEETLDSAIFPAALSPGMDVREFKMIYYNPWDPQWLGYLTVAYSEADYARETERLAAFPRGNYEGIYSVTGFAEEPLAVNVDDYAGFLYAIPTPGEANSVTYVLMEFCNYFYDLNYRGYIPEDYLPLGFDATEGNLYRAMCMKTKGLSNNTEPIDLAELSDFKWSNMSDFTARINFGDFDYHFSELRPLWKLLTEYAEANSGDFDSLP